MQSPEYNDARESQASPRRFSADRKEQRHRRTYKSALSKISSADTFSENCIWWKARRDSGHAIFFLPPPYLFISIHPPSFYSSLFSFLSFFFFSLFLRRDPSSSCSTPFGDPFLLRFPSPSPLPPRSFVRPAHQNPRFLRAFLSSTEPSYQVPLSTHPAAACPRFSRVLPRSSVFIFVLSQFRLDTLALTGQWVSGKHLLRFLLPSYTILATGYWRAGGACTLTSLHRPLSAFLFYFYAFAAPGPSPGNSPYKSEKWPGDRHFRFLDSLPRHPVPFPSCFRRTPLSRSRTRGISLALFLSLSLFRRSPIFIRSNDPRF